MNSNDMNLVIKMITEYEKETYFKTYTEAVNAALEYSKKKGYETNKEELADIIGINSKRPKTGQTTKVDIPLYKNGKLQKKYLHRAVYAMENSYELTRYIN